MDVTHYNLRAILRGHTLRIGSVVRLNEESFSTLGFDGTIRIYNIRSREVKEVVRLKNETTYCMCITKNKKYVLIGRGYRKIIVLSYPSFNFIKKIDLMVGSTLKKIIPLKNNYFVTIDSGEFGTVFRGNVDEMLKLESYQGKQLYRHERGYIYCICETSDESLILAGGSFATNSGCRLVAIDWRKGRVRKFTVRHSKGIIALCQFKNEKEMIVSSGRDGCIIIRDFQSGIVFSKLKDVEETVTCILKYDKNQFVCSGMLGSVYMLQLVINDQEEERIILSTNLELIHQNFKINLSSITGMCWVGDRISREMFVCACRDYSVKLFVKSLQNDLKERLDYLRFSSSNDSNMYDMFVISIRKTDKINCFRSLLLS